MSNADNLPATVLDRKAVVYVRQSTQAQVETNTESRRRQYELVETARAHGFRSIEVIDDDLGRSASGMKSDQALIGSLRGCAQGMSARSCASTLPASLVMVVIGIICWSCVALLRRA